MIVIPASQRTSSRIDVFDYFTRRIRETLVVRVDSCLILFSVLIASYVKALPVDTPVVVEGTQVTHVDATRRLCIL